MASNSHSDSSIGWPSELSGVRLVIFDFGGVLRDNSVSINEGLRLGFESQGIPYAYNVDDVWRLRGIGKFDTAIECIKVQLALEVRGESSRLREIIANPAAETILDELVGRTLDARLLEIAEQIRLKYKEFTDSPEIGHLITIFPYVSKAIDRISEKGYLVALLTNGSRNMIERDLPFPAKFDAIVSENDVLQKKPSGQGIQQVLQQLSCTPSEAIFVVDAGNDVLAGRDAGVGIVGVLAGMGTFETLYQLGLSLIIEDVDQLSRVLPHRGPLVELKA